MAPYFFHSRPLRLAAAVLKERNIYSSLLLLQYSVRYPVPYRFAASNAPICRIEPLNLHHLHLRYGEVRYGQMIGVGLIEPNVAATADGPLHPSQLFGFLQRTLDGSSRATRGASNRHLQGQQAD